MGAEDRRVQACLRRARVPHGWSNVLSPVRFVLFRHVFFCSCVFAFLQPTPPIVIDVYQWSRGEDSRSQSRPYGEEIEGGTHISAECKLYREERDVIEVGKVESEPRWHRIVWYIRQCRENDGYTRREMVTGRG